MRIILILLTVLISSCTGTLSKTDSAAFPYEINYESMKQRPIKKIVMASANFGRPTLSYLRNSEIRIKRYVESYLKDNGYEILPSYHFDNAWKQAVRSFGNPFDPSTGRIDPIAWQQVMTTTIKTISEQSHADAVVFADLIEHPARHNIGQQHSAIFNGVSRKPFLQGSSKSVSLDFDWNQPIKVGSLLVNIYNTNLERVFMSYGGISTIQAIETKRSSDSYIRRKKLFNNEGEIEDGVEIAFHPFIKMDDYPGVERPLTPPTAPKPQ